MKDIEMETEEAKAVFQFGLGILVIAIVNMIKPLSNLIMIIIAIVLIVGAKGMEEMEKKYHLFQFIRRKKE